MAKSPKISKETRSINTDAYYKITIGALGILLIAVIFFRPSPDAGKCEPLRLENISGDGLNESLELYLGDCLNLCGDGTCQQIICRVEVEQEGANDLAMSQCEPSEQKRLFKEYWDHLRYFKANVTCPETLETCPLDCGNDRF